MKWIKVEDRLPEVDVNVIALTSRGKVMVTSMIYDKFNHRPPLLYGPRTPTRTSLIWT